jgi:hypothetical protein
LAEVPGPRRSAKHHDRDAWITPAQLAEFLKCSPQTLRKRATSSEVPRYTVGGEYRYFVYDLLDYVIGSGTDRGADRSDGDPERS